MARFDEEQLLTVLRASLPEAAGVPLGIGDDAALLELRPGEQLVATVDDAREGAHFRRRWCPLPSVAARAVGAAVSDLAAMGARPVGALLALQLGDAVDADDIRELLIAAGRALGELSCPLVGGNLSRAPGGLGLSITALGAVPAGRALRRDAARPGDELWLSAPLGRSAAAFAALEAGRNESVPAAWLERYLNPRPRLELGQALSGATELGPPPAALDISDGLARDATRLARASGVDLILRGDPEDPAAICGAAAPSLGGGWRAWAAALSSGEEYELLIAASPSYRPRLEAHGAILIGAVAEGQGALRDARGATIDPGLGFDHFAEVSKPAPRGSRDQETST